MDPTQLDPSMSAAPQAVDGPSPQLVQAASQLGVDSDTLNALYTHVKSQNPNAPDGAVLGLVKAYASSPQGQLQNQVSKQQSVQNALPSADEIKAANDPAIAGKIDQFYNDPSNVANRALTRANAERADLYRQQAGGSPVNVQENDKAIGEQLAGITEPQRAASAATKEQMSQLADSRNQLQAGIENIQKNATAAVTFQLMDPTSNESKYVVSQLIKMGVPLPQQAVGTWSAYMAQQFFGDKGIGQTVTGMINQTTQAAAAKQQASAATTEAGAKVTESRAQAQNAATEAGRLKMQQDVLGTGNGKYVVSGNGVELSPQSKAQGEGDYKEFNSVRDQQVDLQNVQNHIDQAINQLQKVNYTGPMANLVSKASPNSAVAKLGADLASVGLDYNKAFAKDAGARAGGNMMIEQKEAENAGNLGQGKQVILRNLERLRQSVALKRAYNDQLTDHYKKNSGDLTSFQFAAPSNDAAQSSLPAGWSVVTH